MQSCPIFRLAFPPVLRKSLRLKLLFKKLSFDTHEVQLCVSDDGCGFDPDLLVSERFGLTGMRERAEKAGGKLVILSRPGEGTDVKLTLPLPALPTPLPPSSEAAAEKATLQ